MKWLMNHMKQGVRMQIGQIASIAARKLHSGRVDFVSYFVSALRQLLHVSCSSTLFTVILLSQYCIIRISSSPRTRPAITFEAMASPSSTMLDDLKDALSAMDKSQMELPSWTSPFMHAVGILETLENNVEAVETAKKPTKTAKGRGGAPTKKSIGETDVARMEEEAIASLHSVSSGVILSCFRAHLLP
jgi:hypothetical protein